MEQDVSDAVLFIGRFHPMMLHLPIGFLLIAFTLEVMSRFQKFGQYKPAVGFVLLSGALSALLATVLGIMLAQGGGYNENLLSFHQWSGIAVTVSSLVTYVLYLQCRTRSSVVLDRVYLTTMVFSAIALAVAGHLGGSLTHGSGYLTQHMPNSLRILAGLPKLEKREFIKITNLNEAVVFNDIIYPILDARCNSCHNASKSKGHLQMHTIETIMKGGESGPVFLAGNAKESEILLRVHLPKNDEDHMPPEGKTPLTEDEIDLLTWWIDEGASFEKKVSELNVNNEIQSVLNEYADPQANQTEVEKLLASEVSPASDQVLKQLQDEGVLIERLEKEAHWLQATVLQKQFSDTLINRLSKVSTQLTWLDLGGTSMTNHALSSLTQFKNLTRLYLENTQVSDEGMLYLQSLPYLEYLNLYGTQISDKGIQYLAGLKNMKKLYVWQTNVTVEGAISLQKALPDLKIDMGLVDNITDSTQLQKPDQVSLD